MAQPGPGVAQWGQSGEGKAVRGGGYPELPLNLGFSMLNVD